MITIFSLDQFHYGYVKFKYGDEAKLLFTDTDSLCYHIQMEDVYKDMQEDQDHLDNSDYPQNHMFHSNRKKLFDSLLV